MRPDASGPGVPDTDDPEEGESDGPPEAPQKPPEPPPETPKRRPMSKAEAQRDQEDSEILRLWNGAGLGYSSVAKAVNLPRATVYNRVQDFIRRGLAEPHPIPAVAQAGDPKAPLGGAMSGPEKSARGRATVEATNDAGAMAVNISDAWYRIGEWATKTFNEAALDDGETDILTFLRDAVEMKKQFANGYGPILDRLHFLEQELEVSQQRIEFLEDARQFRKELMEYVWLANLQGKPFTGDQLVVLVLGRDPMLQVPNTIRSNGAPPG
jgi:hypothetical protein